VATNISVWSDTNVYITNLIRYHSEAWITASDGTNETPPAIVFKFDNTYQFVAVYVDILGTGSVYQAGSIIGPWTLLNTNHGRVLSLTNPTSSRFIQGPGGKVSTLKWNN
jgi:hypothetical protein